MTQRSSSLHHRDGFTLVELSIVLVIVALVLGGIVMGRDMINTAAVRSAAAQIQDVQAAVNAYKLKLNAIPGDDPQAYARWGANCDAVAAVCNGNGDGRICVGACGDYKENNVVFRHLDLAGLYRGPMVNTGSGNNITYYAPASPSGKTLRFGVRDSWLSLSLQSELERADAYAIDTKIDDGNGTTGKVRRYAPGTNSTHCQNAARDWFSDAEKCSLQYIGFDVPAIQY